MRVTRIYQSTHLSENQIIALDNNASNHILRVLRLKPGALLKIFNGEGGEYNSELIAVEKKQALIKIKKFIAIERESPLPIHLLQGISRGEKMDYIIQKAVELGATTITPLFTEFSNVKLADDRLDKRITHWRAVVISACEQCGRNRIPVINPPQRLEVALQKSSDNDLKLILDPKATQGLAEMSQPISVTLLVGPEGGLGDSEIMCAIQNNFIGLQLGPRILRTETAGLAAIAALQTKWGDLGNCRPSIR